MVALLLRTWMTHAWSCRAMLVTDRLRRVVAPAPRAAKPKRPRVTIAARTRLWRYPRLGEAATDRHLRLEDEDLDLGVGIEDQLALTRAHTATGGTFDLRPVALCQMLM